MGWPHFDFESFFRFANSLISGLEGLVARLFFAWAACKGIYLSLFASKKPPS